MKFDQTSATHNSKWPQAYYILRALYKHKNNATIVELAKLANIGPDRASKRPRYYKKIKSWCRRRLVGRAYVYYRIPGRRGDDVLRELRKTFRGKQ